MRPMRWSVGAAAAASLWLAGCSALVSGDGEMRCDLGAATDPCPAGMTCTAVTGEATGVCVARENCATTDRDGDGYTRCGVDSQILDCDDANPAIFPGAPEQCNGVDDDCDMNILEELEDADDDGYTRCGNADGPPDCDEENPERHPGASEVCDGIDNDCDGTVDEPPADTTCDAGEVCASAGRGCVKVGCTVTGCPAGMHCDTTLAPASCVSDACTITSCPAGQRFDREACACAALARPGQACGSAADCESGVCVDSDALNLPGTPPARVCVQACCSDNNCVTDQICWDGGRGARSCLPPALLGSTPGGAGGPTAACSSGAECRSGVCEGRANLCAASCTADATCGDRLTCMPLLVEGPGLPRRGVLTCSATERGHGGDLCASGGANCADSCGSADDCAVGLCFTIGAFDSACSNACGTGADCPLLGTKCGTLDATGDGAGWTTVCRAKQTFGAGGQGASCSTDSDCDQERCINGHCANPCCAPDQCSGDDVCAPVRNGSHWEMRCVPRS